MADAHVHFFSHRFFQTLASQMTQPPPEADRYAFLGKIVPWEFPEPDPTRLAERWRMELFRQGVSKAALIASVPGDEESVSAAVRAAPDRFAGYFMLDPNQENVAERAAWALGELGLRGVCLFPAMHRFSLRDDRLPPVLEAVRAHRGVVFVHCGILKVAIREKLGLPCRFDVSLANSLDVCPLALDFPEVPFVIPHFGCGMFGELLLAAAHCPNLHVDTSSSNDWVKRLPVPLDLAGVFRRALDVLGPDRILFGTDSTFFPRGWRRDVFEEQVKVLQALNLPAPDAAKILGGNWERLFGG
ncbi:MAG: amidohydrolase family protein [Planctomycetes bacterium]|nr:amidohydrolase family protein [Planctomycetota bacterium]